MKGKKEQERTGSAGVGVRGSRGRGGVAPLRKDFIGVSSEWRGCFFPYEPGDNGGEAYEGSITPVKANWITGKSEGSLKQENNEAANTVKWRLEIGATPGRE